jgi:hypothetical protein
MLQLYDKHTLGTVPVAHAEYAIEVRQMYGTHTLAFRRIFVRMKIISLIFIRFSYVCLIRNSVTGPLAMATVHRQPRERNERGLQTFFEELKG